MHVTRACLIGVSGFGQVHYDDLLRECAAGRMRAMAATIINQGEESKKCSHLTSMGCRIFDKYTDMVKWCTGRVDLCMIPTGIPFHKEMTMAALEAGLNVLLEKPVAGSIQDVLEIDAFAKKKGLTVCVGFQDIYNPVNMELKRALLGGIIGPIQHIRSVNLASRDAKYYGRNGWAGRIRVNNTWVLDSPFNNAVAHELLMMMFLAGSKEQETMPVTDVEAELYRGNDVENADTVCARLNGEGGMPLMFIASHAPDGDLTSMQITGSKGRISWTRSNAQVEVGGKLVHEFVSPAGSEIRTHMLKAVCSKIHGEEAFVCGLDMASRQTLVMNGIHEASPINVVDAAHIVSLGAGLERKHAINGMQALSLRALEKGLMFSEESAPPWTWVRPAGRFFLRGYSKFTGGKTGMTGA